MNKVKPYPVGVDLMWLGQDQNGVLAAFITAGFGPVPESMLDEAGQVVADIESELLDLPRVSDAQLHVAVPRPDDFVSLAERGFLVFDWRDAHRSLSEETECYELVASPKSFASPSEKVAARSIPVVRLSGLIFSHRVSLRGLERFIKVGSGITGT
jgi:hypothetical protein